MLIFPAGRLNQDSLSELLYFTWCTLYAFLKFLTVAKKLEKERICLGFWFIRLIRSAFVHLTFPGFWVGIALQLNVIQSVASLLHISELFCARGGFKD